MKVALALLGPIVNAVVAAIFTPENFQKYSDMFFDLVEEVVTDSETPIDDVLVLPIVRNARSILGVLDRAEAVESETPDDEDEPQEGA